MSIVASTDTENIFDDMRKAGKLFAYSNHDIESEWKRTFVIPPPLFYQIITNDLPLGSSVSVELLGGDAEFSIQNKGIFSAENKLLRCQKELEICEVKVEENSKQNGIGKALLRNFILYSKLTGIEEIKLVAGRENGEFFWSRRGAVLEDYHRYKEQFVRQVENNIEKLGDKVPEELRIKVNGIIDKNDVAMNFNIASMSGLIDGKPAGIAILWGTSPRLHFNLNDTNQMRNLSRSLRTSKRNAI